MLAANDVASVILTRSVPWTDAMSLQKLLYYVQAWHLAITGEPLFDEQIKAWKDGPVVPAVWHARKDRETRRAAEQPAVVIDEFASDLIDLVLGTYGSMSAEELSALTHVEQPWKAARGDLPDGAECRTPISRSSMAKFYRGNRRLGGRTAADLAAGGVHVRRADAAPPDVGAILEGLGSDLDDAGDDPWGSANLHDATSYESDHADAHPRRSYAGL